MAPYGFVSVFLTLLAFYQTITLAIEPTIGFSWWGTCRCLSDLGETKMSKKERARRIRECRKDLLNRRNLVSSSEAVGRLANRADRAISAKRMLVSETLRSISRKPRPSRMRSVSPVYGPQLKRLIVSPFSLTTGRGSRQIVVRPRERLIDLPVVSPTISTLMSLHCVRLNGVRSPVQPRLRCRPSVRDYQGTDDHPSMDNDK